MSKKSGYIVKTKSGKEGRTYHAEGLVNKKTIVHVNVDGKEVKMLCDPKSIEIIGYID
jgi:hypothetical protein